jgi:peptidoglycan/xylan/chitin deacetylase (PgdA/CDA1 family)
LWERGDFGAVSEGESPDRNFQGKGGRQTLVNAKTFVKKTLVSSRVLDFAARFAPASAVILMYHSVQDQPELYVNSIGAGIIHSTAVFTRHMEIVARRFNPVPLTDLLLFLNGARHLPRRPVVVTFDDGFTDNSQIAAPVLNRIGIPASFYLTVALIGTQTAPWYCRVRHALNTTTKGLWRDSVEGSDWKLSTPQQRTQASQVVWDRCAKLPQPEREEAVNALERELEVPTFTCQRPLMMSWDDARSLHRAGHIVGSHTLNHPNVAHIGEADALMELVESKRVLEMQLAAPVEHFSYPHPALNPNWNALTLALCRQAGYRSALTTDLGPVREGANPLALPRVSTPCPETDILWYLDCAFLGRKG